MLRKLLINGLWLGGNIWYVVYIEGRERGKRRAREGEATENGRLRRMGRGGGLGKTLSDLARLCLTLSDFVELSRLHEARSLTSVKLAGLM